MNEDAKKMTELVRPWTTDEETKPSGIISGSAILPVAVLATGRSSAEFNPSRHNTEGNKSSKKEGSRAHSIMIKMVAVKDTPQQLQPSDPVQSSPSLKNLASVKSFNTNQMNEDNLSKSDNIDYGMAGPTPKSQSKHKHVVSRK